MSLSIGELTSPQKDHILSIQNIAYEEAENRPLTHLFCRTSDREFVHLEIFGHYPSFYVKEDEWADRLQNHPTVKETSKGHTSLHGHELRKVYMTQPTHVADFSERFSQTWEADVFYATRFLIDNGLFTVVEFDADDIHERITENHYRLHYTNIEPCEEHEDEYVDPRICTLDIEVAAKDGFPEPEDAEEPVTTIVAHDSYTDEYTSWALKHDAWDDDVDLGDTRVFDSEKGLLQDVNTYISQTQFDVLTGWNSNGFDYPYLIQRCRNLSVWSYYDWSPIENVYVSGRGEPVVDGVTCLDMLDGYKKTQMGTLKKGTLEYVATEELGEGKVPHVDDVPEDENEYLWMWQHEIEQFMEYNHRDVEAVIEIDEEVGVMELFINLRQLVGCQFDSCDPNVSLLDVMFLREAYEQNIVLPTAEEPDDGWYYGAWVKEPESGLHKHTIYPDLASLYPNIGLQSNTSPETKIGTKGDLQDSEYTEDDCVWSYIDTRADSVKKDTEPEYEKCYYLDHDTKKGFVTHVIDKIMRLNDIYKGTDLYAASKAVRNSCFTGDTDVLTPNGIVNIKDLTLGDTVYSLNEDTWELEEKPVVDVHHYPDYDGDIYHIESQKIDLKVTDDHELLTNNVRYEDEYERHEASDLNQYTRYKLPHGWEYDHGEERETIDLTEWVDEYEVLIIPNVHGHTFRHEVSGGQKVTSKEGGYKLDADDFESQRETIEQYTEKMYIHRGEQHKWIPVQYDADDFIELLAWYVAEGSTYTSERVEYENGNVRGVCDQLCITQAEENYLDDVVDLFERMNLPYSHADGAVEMGNSLFVDIVRTQCGEGSQNKKIPDFIFELSERQKRLFHVTCIKGDGDSRDDRWRYSTQSDQLCEDYAQLLLQLGKNPQVSEGISGVNDTPIWRIYDGPSKNNFQMDRNNEMVDSEGVYCVTVADNHMLVVGRNGKFQHVPNCYGVLGDSNSFGTGFRLFDKDVAESITLGGRKVIQYSAEQFIDYINTNYDVGHDEAYMFGGDSDSVMTSLPFVDGGKEALDISMEAASYLNDSYESFVKETFGSDHNKMEIEVESYASTCFYPEDLDSGSGIKKRYAQLVEWDDDDFWLDESELKIKGFDYVRGDTANVTADLQYDVLSIILDDESNKRDRVVDRVRETVDSIRSGAESTQHDSALSSASQGETEDGDVSIGEYGIPFGIGQSLGEYGSVDRTPMPKYRGAKYANEYIYETNAIQEGDKPLYFYVSRVHGHEYPKRYNATTAEDGDTVDAVSVLEAEDLPDCFEVDTETMIQKTVVDPLERIFVAMGWHVDDVLVDSDQSDLSAYM